MPEEVWLVRGLERIIVDLGGVMAIYLVYKLFVMGVTRKINFFAEVENKVISGKMKLLNASPGIIFAIVGCVIISYTFLSPPYYKAKGTSTSQQITTEQPGAENLEFDIQPDVNDNGS